MDKSGANYAGLANINLLLILAGFATMIDICQVKIICAVSMPAIVA
jgi:putative transposase